MKSSTVSSGVNTLYVIFLSLVAALGGFLFGYDTAVISGTIGMVSEQFHLDAFAQGWYVSSALIGSMAGVLAAGWLSDRAGRKRAMAVSAVFFLVSAIGCALAAEMTFLIVYRILGGIGIGMISIISPMYISEIALARIRGGLVSLYQLAITIGFVGAYIANYNLLEFSGSRHFGEGVLNLVFHREVWRGMLGMEAVPAFLFLGVIMCLPESPRWLLLKKKRTEAGKVLQKIYGSARQVSEQIKAIDHGSGQRGGGMSAIFRHSVFRRMVWIGAAIALLGQFMGVNAVLYYGPVIFEKSGLSGGDALFYQVLIGSINAITTILALLIIDRVGRKFLVYLGVSGMIVSLVLIALYFTFSGRYGLSDIWLLCFFLAYIFFTAGSISAVIFVLLSEMFPTVIRGSAMAVTGFALWIGTFLIGQFTPWFLDTLTPQGTFVFFAIMCLPYLYIIHRYVPETAGKSLEEIEEFWFRK
ncbi:sugar porter family MFS transporter [Sinomicrobium soli]|uniref:sugar porter family MFS transporter n=1 Tax=Sinomicrobium sp. N-1-3-6 TaxID=2219864 RepID=UPI000DCE49FF|nr:sugar porter family MFS transporter [Sinomicrobium sp. N-1-3-6]RAV28434.1 MFS transporter [Sinomicrobium sp. N-1-3-6]